MHSKNIDFSKWSCVILHACVPTWTLGMSVLLAQKVVVMLYSLWMHSLGCLERSLLVYSSVRDPVHGHIFFGKQASVDEYVAFYSDQKEHQTCSDFLAGDALRSSRRYHALDETGVFGCACRHEFPLLFINLKHGERLSYGVWLLHELLHRLPEDSNIFVLYDIACNLLRHLKVRNETELLERLVFALPSFHAYGHKASCQILFSPLRCEGIGLSDGEVMERLWSYLRRFSRMTKEMRPSHRADVLSHALMYYGLKTKWKLCTLLVRRWRRAQNSLAVTSHRYDELISSSELPISEETILEWIETEKVIITSSDTEQHITTKWQTHYFYMLQSYYISRSSLMSCAQTEIVTMREKVFGMEEQLAKFEQRHGIAHRWKESDPEYNDGERAFLKEKQEQLHASLWASVNRRYYLLKMKAKYADGQKIAKRLSSNISKETKKARLLLNEYNTTALQIDSSYVLFVVLQKCLTLELSSGRKHLVNTRPEQVRFHRA